MRGCNIGVIEVITRNNNIIFSLDAYVTVVNRPHTKMVDVKEEIGVYALKEPVTNPTEAPLRIACLEPSATAICFELGLGEYIVGVTHECGPILDQFFSDVSRNAAQNSAAAKIQSRPLVMTWSGLTVNSQADIHLAIQKTAAAAAAAASQVVCPIRSKENDDIPLPPSSTEIPSTYPLIEDRMQAAQPTVIFTQDLCDVCAPTTADVRRCLIKNSGNGKEDESERIVSVVALQPEDLHEVTDTFVTIAEACGVPERGRRMKDKFLKNLKELQTAIQINRKNNTDATTMPTLFILEWLDPVFDSGHWTCEFSLV